MGLNDTERLALLEDALLRLRESAAGSLVVVEGVRDKAALEELGVGGRHVSVNQGLSQEVLIDRIADDMQRRPRHRVVLLLDWDRTGGRLAQRLEEGLRARVPLDTQCRRRLAIACHSKTLEDVPGELAALRRNVGSSRPHAR